VSERSRSGLPLKSFYSASDHADKGAEDVPGAYPFTRGRLRPASADHGWIHRELSGEGDANRSNEQLKYLLGIGQTGIDVIGDSPTQSMVDPDHPLVRHSVGTQGVSLYCQADYLDLFRDIPVDRISISSSVPAIFALTGLLGAVDAFGFAHDKVRGSVLQPPLYCSDASYSCGMPVSLPSRLSVDTIEYSAVNLALSRLCRGHLFLQRKRPGCHRGNGAGFVQIRHLVRCRAGHTVDRFAPRVRSLSTARWISSRRSRDRATRRLYAKMMKNEFGAEIRARVGCHHQPHIGADPFGAAADQQCHPRNDAGSGAGAGRCQAMEISAFDEGSAPSAEAI
jgi:methylmalonyl-CoA mutase N-terminal domain/subunit